MTDKHIIIDGIDVSGCSYGEIEKDIFKCSCEYNVRSASMFCKDNHNCYFKQLKRKEQECEELKQFLSKEPLAIQALQSGYADYKKRSEVFFEMIKQYKQALTEIEEIAKPQTYYINIKQNKTATELVYDYANIAWNLEQKMHKILQKCEVLEQ